MLLLLLLLFFVVCLLMRTSSCLASRGFATMARKEQTKHKTHEREHLHTINQAPTATSTRTDANNNVRSHLGSGLRVRSAQVRYPDGRVCSWVYPFSGGLSSIFIPPNDDHPACQENTGSTRRWHQRALGRPGTPLTRSSFWRRESSWPPSRTSPRQPTALTARRGRGQHRHPLSARSTRSQKRRTRSRTKRLSDARIATTRC